MLIPFQRVKELLEGYRIPIYGILHLGAHRCEELAAYTAAGVAPNKIVWIEAQPNLVEEMKQKGVQNIFNHCILDTEGEKTFRRTNNGESSSVLEFDLHSQNHPDVQVIGKDVVKTITLKRFFDEHPEFQTCNFWNLDIQGVELRAMKSAGKYINNVDAIYTEVNTKEVYKGCDKMKDMSKWLRAQGFELVRSQVKEEYGWGDALYVRVR